MAGSFKSRAARVVALLLLCSACTPAVEEPESQATTRDVQGEVREYLAEYNAAFAAADTARIRALYVGDDRLVWIEDGAVKYRSVSDIFESLNALPPGLSVETTLSDVSIVTLSDAAVTVRALFSTEFSSGDGGGFSFGGALSMVLEHDGATWRAVSGHTSTAGEAWDSP